MVPRVDVVTVPDEVSIRKVDLASELLTITSDQELDQFLGKLARSVVRNASKFVKSPIGKALGAIPRFFHQACGGS